jgi:3-oxoacyl-[acyl-carrier protein] reductase
MPDRPAPPTWPDVATRSHHGKTAVVTGATSGIGRAIAQKLATEGASVIIHGRDADRADQFCRELRADGADVVAILADLRDAGAREKLVREAWSWKSGVDVWINNAGADVLTGDIAKQDFAAKLALLWEVDVQATIDLSRRIGPRMFERATDDRPGAIVHIGWDQAETGMSGDAGEMFGPIKAAVMAFSRSLAQSLAPRVRVNCVAPGWIRTAWGDQASSYWHERAERESLRNRWGTAEDIAAVVSFVASDAADFMSGQTLPVNGGFRYGFG